MSLNLDIGLSEELDTGLSPGFLNILDIAAPGTDTELGLPPAFGPSSVFIQFKRGLEANLPSTLLAGEPAFTTDSNRAFVGTGSGKVEAIITPLSAHGSVTTTDATQTTCGSLTLADNTSYLVEAHVIARQTSGGSAGQPGGYFLMATVFRHAAGGAAMAGSVTQIHIGEGVAGFDATLDVTSNDVRVRVTGAAGVNVNWKSTLSVRKLTS